MHTLYISADDSAAWMKDDVSAAELLAFAKDGGVFGRIRLSSLVDSEQFDYFVGPVSHVGALTDAFERYLQGVEAIDGRLVIKTQQDGGPLSAIPSIPSYRPAKVPPMHPAFIGALFLKLQECLDAGDDVMSNVLRFEMDYPGDKIDDRDAGFYSSGLNVSIGSKRASEGARELLQKLEATVDTPEAPIHISARSSVPDEPPSGVELLVPEPTPEERALADIKLFELPVLSTHSSPRSMRITVGAKPLEERANRVVAKPAIDWSGLPVQVVEQRLSDEQSLLRANLVKTRQNFHP
jgi:hypothetical protein